MSDCSVHVKWKDLADELMRQDSRLLRQGICTRSSERADVDTLCIKFICDIKLPRITLGVAFDWAETCQQPRVASTVDASRVLERSSGHILTFTVVSDYKRQRYGNFDDLVVTAFASL